MRKQLNHPPEKHFNGTLALLVCLMVFTLLFAFLPASAQGSRKVFLPLVRNGSENAYEKKFIGIYMEQYWTEQNVQTYMPKADQLAGGKKHTVSGWFITLQNIAFTNRQTDIRTNNFYRQLEALWKYGYISFVNVNSASESSNWDVSDNCPIGFTAYQVARGDCDRAIERMADLYRQWVSQGRGRIAFIAPLQEMNGVNADGSIWTTYGGDAENFKLAYQRIQHIFSQRGVPRDQVWWVFAPNGWSKEGHEFERYYPGNEITDVVAFSSYNYGYCPVAIPWQKWESYGALFAGYISRMQAMAPGKPIIIAQTGTTAQYPKTGNYDNRMKNQWLIDNYNYLASQPAVLGVLYYDFSPAWECDWSITQGGPFTGYTNGVANPAYQYLSVQDLAGMGF